jgi:hypothetical protein
MPFYPSYYPQEITLEYLSPAAAAPRLARGALHAYLGGDPFGGRPLPQNVSGVESLAGYVVVTVNPAGRDAAARCRVARDVLGGLAAAPGRWRVHPYPVTPQHPDYLQHADLARAAAVPARPAPGPPPGLRLRARGMLARLLAGAGDEAGPWDARVEEVALADLLEPQRTAHNGWTGPPWLKQGWFHAYLLQAPAMAERDAREAADALAAQLMRGSGTLAERLDAERELLRRLGAGCERVVAGYVLRREPLGVEYSGGVENVAWDSLDGLRSGIFLRTVKLKDFPWNGWLSLGLAGRPDAAWNPVAGFGDPAGRVLWAALGDPALLAEPYAGGWMDNRVRLQRGGEPVPAAGVAVPPDAVLPEPGTGRLRPVGPGRTARARLTYRVLSSAFHDGTRTGPADLLHAYALAYAWGEGRPGTPGHDPEVARATALLRQWLVGLRVLRVDRDVLRFGEVRMDYEVPVVEVYLAHPGAGPELAAAVAPPWSALPWHGLALMEEAVRRGWAAFSAGEARRRGRPWLDPVRDPALGRRLAALAGELGGRGHVPESIRDLVPPAEAAARWSALQRFAAAQGHWLVTNGPYQLQSWTPARTVLRVVRDFSYPLGVGSYNQHPIPVRGYVARAERRDGALRIRAQVERVERFAREHRIVTGPVERDWPERDRGAVPTCRFVLLGPDGRVVAAGALPPDESGGFAIPLDGAAAAARTALVAVTVRENLVDLDVRAVRLAP